ncbi:class I SAM-dependent methyltransferase [Aestuariimicrobium soli]|uniref:class I SAM-dependent methyltransferase n=1 Tax=Aestuariimicrobium soli TaxID=2035834 RepID=UPI003EB9BDE4
MGELSEQSRAVAGLFSALADDYDRSGVDFFVPMATGLVEALAVQPGEACLDLGCGPGTASLVLAHRVGPTGRVLGVDLSDAMVQRARQEAADRGVRVDYQVADAQDPEVPPGSFDVVASAMVIFFLPDPWRALGRWVELLRPGGRIGVSTFGPASPGWLELNSLLQPWLPKLDPKAQRATPDEVAPSFDTDEGMVLAFEQAGATQVVTHRMRVTLPLADAAQWEAFTRTLGQRHAWMQMSPSEADGVREKAAALIAGLGPDDICQDVRFTVGVRP